MVSQVHVDIHANALKGQLQVKVRLTHLKSVCLFGCKRCQVEMQNGSLIAYFS